MSQCSDLVVCDFTAHMLNVDTRGDVMPTLVWSVVFD